MPPGNAPNKCKPPPEPLRDFHLWLRRLQIRL
jgi:hypothetical protein